MQTDAWKHFAQGGPIEALGLQEVEGRLDLRGIAIAPEGEFADNDIATLREREFVRVDSPRSGHFMPTEESLAIAHTLWANFGVSFPLP